MLARTLLPVFIVCSSFLSYAQDSYFGIKTGYTRATLLSDGDRVESLDPQYGFSGAMVFSTKIPNFPLGFSMEPGYVLKGSKTERDTFDYKLNYISMPFLVDIYPLRFLKFSVGVEPAYISTAKIAYDSGEKEDFESLNRNWEISGLVGASVSLAFFMDLGVRYHVGFNEVIAQDPNLGLENLRTEYLQVFLLFKIAN